MTCWPVSQPESHSSDPRLLYVDNTRYDYAKKGKSQAWDPHTLSPMGRGMSTTARSFGRNFPPEQLCHDVQGHVLGKCVGVVSRGMTVARP